MCTTDRHCWPRSTRSCAPCSPPAGSSATATTTRCASRPWALCSASRGLPGRCDILPCSASCGERRAARGQRRRPSRALGPHDFLCVPAAQVWHPDTFKQPGLVNAFLPLVPLSEVNGPTALALGSHRPPRPCCPRVVRPLLEAGEVLLFDWRTWHRGCANSSRADRPVAYVTYARRGVEGASYKRDLQSLEASEARSDRGRYNNVLPSSVLNAAFLCQQWSPAPLRAVRARAARPCRARATRCRGPSRDSEAVARAPLAAVLARVPGLGKPHNVSKSHLQQQVRALGRRTSRKGQCVSDPCKADREVLIACRAACAAADLTARRSGACAAVHPLLFMLFMQ